MSDNTITIVGNLTSDPELRFTSGGVSVANVTIASTPRVYNKSKQEWEDGEALFLRGTIWKDAADNVADSLHKGVRVVVTGKLKQRSWEDAKTGDKRSAVELEIEEIGPSLRFTTVTVEGKPKPSYGGGSDSGRGNPWTSDDDESPF